MSKQENETWEDYEKRTKKENDDYTARKVRQLRIKNSVAAFIVVGFLVGIAVVPITGLVSYTYGGKYGSQEYPLIEGAQWIETAQSTASQAPTYINPSAQIALIEQQASRGWAYLNQSDAASGVGMGSPCWLFPTPSQTYGYPNTFLRETFSYLGNVSAAHGLLNNSQFQAALGIAYNLLGNVYNAMSNLNAAGPNGNALPNIQDCIKMGGSSWFTLFFSDVAFIILMLGTFVWWVSRDW